MWGGGQLHCNAVPILNGLVHFLKYSMVESPIDPDPLPCFPLFREQTTCFSWLIDTQRLKQTALISIIFGEAETREGGPLSNKDF